MSALTTENLNLLQVESISLSIGSALFGVYVIIAVLSLLSLFSQGKAFTSGRRFLFVVITAMLFCDTVNAAVSTYSVAHDIHSLEGPFHPEGTRILTLTAAILSKINFFLSDLIIVWRAWSIFQERTITFQIVLISCIFLSFGAVVTDTVLVVEASSNLKEPFELNYAVVRLVLPLTLLFTNIVATSLIASRAWMFHQAVKQADQSRRVKNVTQILRLLVESGCLYCLLWIVVVIDIAENFSTEVTYMLTSIIPHLTCIYPCLMVLIILIGNQRYDNVDSTIWSTSPYILSNSV
ncbi:hypothetical protein J3R30DRAFT_613941 [Lentinula aciculospora]|uniref:Uncharacterized protein n=1 Tax=Lentinula aciculospora TaxID=153920 RepID=A0A9W9A6S5_9AGAR|nr:hypothetical protein J3R30DRAFT_613941 [Lentinula aciculospora]